MPYASEFWAGFTIFLKLFNPLVPMVMHHPKWDLIELGYLCKGQVFISVRIITVHGGLGQVGISVILHRFFKHPYYGAFFSRKLCFCKHFQFISKQVSERSILIGMINQGVLSLIERVPEPFVLISFEKLLPKVLLPVGLFDHR